MVIIKDVDALYEMDSPTQEQIIDRGNFQEFVSGICEEEPRPYVIVTGSHWHRRHVIDASDRFVLTRFSSEQVQHIQEDYPLYVVASRPGE